MLAVARVVTLLLCSGVRIGRREGGESWLGPQDFSNLVRHRSRDWHRTFPSYRFEARRDSIRRPDWLRAWLNRADDFDWNGCRLVERRWIVHGSCRSSQRS
jgi:hypothetical protein